MDPDTPRHVPEHVSLDATGSTSDKLLEMADEGAPEHALVVAREQFRARGGSGQLHAPSGGLWFSTLWYPGIPVDQAALLTLAASWGVREGIRRATGVAAGLKWPNDLILEGRKLGGVTVEGRVQGNAILQAVVGVGVNVNNPLHLLPDDVSGRATTLQEVLGEDLDLSDLLDPVTAALIGARKLLEDPKTLIRDVLSCWTQRGTEVRIDAGHMLLEGTARRIDPDGALVIENEAGLHRVEDPCLAKFVRVVG